MTVELRHLRYLVAVADAGSLNRAAAALHMSQPPLTRQLRALEREVGDRLLDRGPRGSVLTPAGQVLARSARRLVADFDAVLAQARRRPRLSGTLGLGFNENLAVPVATPLVRVVREAHPELTVVPHTLDRLGCVAGLASGLLDLALLRSPFDDPDLVVVPLLREPVTLILPGRHPLAARPEVPLAALAGRPWITVVTAGAYSRRPEIERRCAAASFAPTWGPAVNDLQSALALVAAGVGVFVGPAATAGIGPRGLAYVPIAGWSSEVVAAHRPRPAAPVRAAVELAGDLTLPGFVSARSAGRPARSPP